MTCEKTTEQLIDWLEGELPPDAAEEVEQHVCGCGDCAKDVREIRHALAAVAHPIADPGEAYFASFYARLRQSREEAPEPVSWLRRWWDRLLAPNPWLRGMAGATALLLAVFGVLAATGTISFRHSPQFRMAKVTRPANGKNNVMLARIDPAVMQEVFSLKKEEAHDFQVQIARVIMGRLANANANARMVALPGERPSSHVLYAPTVVDLSTEELAEVTTELQTDAKNWAL